MPVGRLPFLSAGLLLTLAVSARAADYEIKIQRPFKSGQSFALIASDTFHAGEKVDLPNGTSTRSSSFRRITLDADVRIDKVDAQGEAAVQSLTLRRLTLQTANSDTAPNPATAKNLVPPGTELTLTFTNSEPSFALKDGGLLSDEALTALQHGTIRMSLTDALHGSKVRQKVGDSWPLGKSALPATRTDPRHLDPDLIDGTIRLKDLRTVAGLECLLLEGTTVTKNLQLEGNVVPREASRTDTFSCTLPTNLGLPVVAWSMKSITRIVTEEKSLAKNIITHTVDSEISHEATWTPKP
jgi:hypothetical protein